MPRKTTNFKRGSGSIQRSVVEDTALRYSKRDIDPLKVHIHDPNKAHMASTIGIIDSGDYYSSDEVEGALQEIGSSGSSTRTNGLLEGGTYTSTFPSITVDNNSKALVNGIERDISSLTIDIGSLGVGNYYVYVETDTTSVNFLQLIATTVRPSLSDEKVLIAFICTDGLTFTYEQDARFFVKDLDRKVQYTVRQGEDLNAWSEGCFATIDSAFFYLSKFHDLGAGVTDDYRATLLVRGNHVIDRPLELDNAFLNTIGIYALTIKGDGQNSITTSGSFVGNNLISLIVDTDDVNYPSAGIILEDLVLKNSGGVALTSLVYLDCSHVHINRCKVRENVGTFLVGAGSISITHTDIEAQRVASITSPTSRLFMDNVYMLGDKTLEGLNSTNTSIQNSRMFNYTTCFVHTSGNLIVSNSEFNGSTLLDGNSVDHFGLTNFIGNKISQSGNATSGTEVLITNYNRVGEFMFTNNICERGGSFNNDYDVWVHTNGFDTITFSDNVFLNYGLLKVVGDTDASSFTFKDNTCKTVNLEIESTGVSFVSGNLLNSDGGASVVPKLKVTNNNFNYNCTVQGNTFISNSSSANNVELSGAMHLTFTGNIVNGGSGTLLTSISRSLVENNIFEGKGSDNSYYNVGALVTLDNCNTLNMKDNHFQNGYGGISSNAGSGLVIEGNRFINLGLGPTPLYVIEIETANLSTTVIVDNIIDSCGDIGLPSATSGDMVCIGIYVSGTASGLVVENNKIDKIISSFSGSTTCVEIACDTLTDSSTSNNHLRPSVYPGTSVDIMSFIVSELTHTKIDNNSCLQDNTAGFDIGIHLQGLTILSDVSVSGNRVEGYNQNGIFFDYTALASTLNTIRLVVENNKLTNTTTQPIDPTRLGCIRLGVALTGASAYFNHVSISRNTIIGPNIGVHVDLNNAATAFEVDVNEFSIDGNRIQLSSSDTSLMLGGVSYYYQTTSNFFVQEDLTINGNVIDLTNNIDCRGIHFYNQGKVNRLTTSHNQINSGTEGIYLQAPSTTSEWSNFLIQSNTIKQAYSLAPVNGIRLTSSVVSWDGITISDNNVESFGQTQVAGKPLYIQVIQNNDSFSNISVLDNVFKGQSGNASTEFGTCEVFVGNGNIQSFLFQGNTVECERGLYFNIIQVNNGQGISVQGNHFKGRHGVVFKTTGGSTHTGLYVKDNLLDVNTSIDINFDYAFGHVFDLQNLTLRDLQVVGNTINTNSNIGGFYVSHDYLSGSKIEGNHLFGEEVETPFIYVVGNQDTALVQGFSIDNNKGDGFLVDGWSGDSPDAIILLEYTQVGTTASGSYYSNISIDGNQIQNSTSIQHVICVIGKGTGTQQFEGMSSLSVGRNIITDTACETALNLDFSNVYGVMEHIDVKDNLLGRGDSTTQPRNGVIVTAPNHGSTPTSFQIQNVNVVGNNIYNRTTGTDEAIKVILDDSNAQSFDGDGNANGSLYPTFNISVSDNDIYTYVDSANTKGIYVQLDCNCKNLKVSGNRLRSQSVSAYPQNGILVTHTLDKGMPFRQTGSSNGNDFAATLSGTVYVAGYLPGILTPDMRVSQDGSGPLTFGVKLIKWENFSVCDNDISYNSRFAESTGVQTQYPLVKNADLFVCPVHYSGLSGGVGVRRLVVVPMYGFEMCNNTLRGLENSDSSEQYVGMVIHTCPVYGEWFANDPLSTMITGPVPQYRYVAQGWNICNNTSTGYTIFDWNGASFDVYGFDVYYLSALLDITNIDDELDRCGLTTGNTTQTVGVQHLTIPVSTTINTLYNGGAVSFNVTIGARVFDLTPLTLPIGGTVSYNKNNPTATKMK